jgi:hypothetical protein
LHARLRKGDRDVTAIRLPMTRIRWRRIAIQAAVLAALTLAASACGASTKVEVLRLRSANPLTSDLYVRLRGPAGAVSYISQGLIRGAFSKGGRGFFVPPGGHRRKACSFSHTIGYADSPKLQAWRGKKMRITVYGNSSYAAIYCRGIRSAVYLSSS